jgi:glycosyltransferase involved in cell wall biosynthesis
VTPTVTVVVPYYNEAGFIGLTLGDLLAQDEPPERLVLVDNGSSDGSEAVCREALRAAPGLDARFAREPRPGKIHALELASTLVDTELVAFWDADTRYPRHYLGRARALARASGPRVVGLMALDLYGRPDSARNRLRRCAYVALSRLVPRQAFTGGYGHVLRADALARAGGFSAERWPWVLLDHEIVHRLHRLGQTRYDYHFWCQPSTRRADRRRVRWTLGERLLYHLVPFAAKDWYFHRWLAPRFAARGLSQLRLRDKPWQPPGR